MISQPNCWIILLLGSYDAKTERLLQELKERLSDHFTYLHETVLIFLLDNLEVYTAEIPDARGQREKVLVIAEIFDNRKRLGIYILNAGEIMYANDVDDDVSLSHEETVRNHLEKSYDVHDFSKPTILTTLEFISGASTLTFVVRNSELTRGGEYIELVYLLSKGSLTPSKTFFMKREGFDLSSMAWEILDKHSIQFRSYTNDENLFREVIRIFTIHVDNSSLV